jgi:hypothetical protein
MSRLADFHLHVAGEGGGDAQPRTEHFEDQRVAALDQLHAAAQAHTQRLEALHLLVVNRDFADDGTNTRRELVQPDESVCGLACGCHSDGKINWLDGKSMNPTAGELRFAVGELRNGKSTITFG